MSDIITMQFNITLVNGNHISLSEKTDRILLESYKGWHGNNWLKSFIAESIENITSRPDVPFNEKDIKEVSFNFILEE